MGKIINMRMPFVNLSMKAGLVLFLTLAASLFMDGGVCLPKSADAAITQLVNWTKAYDQVSGTGSGFNVTVPTGTGAYRFMVVGITQTFAASAIQANPTTITYGGQTLTNATTNSATSNRTHTWLYYLKDNAVMDNTARPLNVTLAGTHLNFQVWVAIYDGVDQAAALTVGTGITATAGSGPAQLTSAMAVNANQQAVYISNINNGVTTVIPTFTINANWTGSGTSTGSSGTTAWDVDVTNRSIPGSNTTDNAATSAIAPAGNIRYAISAMSLPAFVDSTPPTGGALSVTAGTGQNSLSWTAASDAFGIASYVLRFATGATAPADCLSGTAVPGSPFSSATFSTIHSGLTGGTQYSYRLCATDTNGNSSAGSTGSGTPKWSSSVNSCGGCHGYTSTFNDGASRNAGGLFQGSHNKHVITQTIVCSNCHVAPATTTSTDYGHSTGQVQMASPLNGGSYSRGASFPVSNTFTPGTCNGTNCHGNVYSTAAGASIAWGATGSGCGTCHTGTPGVFQGNGAPATGSHDKHITAGAACGDCHTGAVANTSGGTGHLNGNITVAAGYPATVTKHTAGSGYSSCSSASCHSSPYGSTPITTPVWGVVSGCGACHKNDATNSNLGAFTGYSSPATVVGPKTGNHVDHLNYARYVCGDCHSGAVSNTSGGSNHALGTVSVIQYAAPVAKHGAPLSYLTNGCAAACHITATWGTQLGCIDCHASSIIRKKGRPGTTLAAVKTEFGLAWGHKKSTRGAVTDRDCIVCHLEGNGTSFRTSKFHADGNIDLRDPDGAGETPITNISNAAWTFQRFSTSYAAATRTSTGHLANTIDNIITQKFCIKCHDAGGATNTTARTAGGTAAMPFGGVALGANYTAANGAIGTQGLVNVDTQFTITNSSVHPVKGPRSKGFPTPARYNAPYNNFTRTGGTTASAATKTDGVVMNCFDCHNVVGTPLTLRTVAAHGNAVTLRGTPFISGTPAAGTNEATLCKVCHAGYDTNTGTNHGASPTTAATNLSRNEKVPFMRYGCNVCHSSGYNTAAVRPVRAMDAHGVNALPSTGQTLSGNWSATGKPYAFIRNRSYLGNHSPALIGGSAANTASSCNMLGSDGNGACGNQGSKTYSIGGSY